MKRTVLGAAFAAAALLVSQPAAEAAPVLANCTLNGQAASATNGTEVLTVSTTSGAYANIPQGSVNFNQRVAGCVIVHYTAEINPSAPLSVRAFLDNATAGNPAEYQLTQTENAITTRSATFVFKTVAAGAHTLRMQFANGNAPNPITIRRQTVVVHYVK